MIYLLGVAALGLFLGMYPVKSAGALVAALGYLLALREPRAFAVRLAFLPRARDRATATRVLPLRTRPQAHIARRR